MESVKVIEICVFGLMRNWNGMLKNDKLPFHDGRRWWLLVAAGCGCRRRRPEVVLDVGGGSGGRWRLPKVVVAGGHFCHLEKLGGNEIEFRQICEGIMNSLNRGIHGIEFHSISNQTTQWNLVNGIDHSNSFTFRRIPANQTPPYCEESCMKI